MGVQRRLQRAGIRVSAHTRRVAQSVLLCASATALVLALSTVTGVCEVSLAPDAADAGAGLLPVAAAHGDHVQDHDHDHSHGDAHEHGASHTHDHAHNHGHAHDHDDEHGDDGHAHCDVCHTHEHDDRVLTEDEKHPYTALALTTVSGMAAAVGGAIVVFVGVPSAWALGHMLSFASGVMLYISYGDLLTHAICHLCLFEANMWMFGGMALMWVVVTLVPEPDMTQFMDDADGGGDGDAGDEGSDDGDGGSDSDDADTDDDMALAAAAAESDSGSDDDGDVLSVADDFGAMKVAELKKACAANGLPTSGLKKRLVARLIDDAISTQKAKAATVAAPKRARRSASSGPTAKAKRGGGSGGSGATSRGDGAVGVSSNDSSEVVHRKSRLMLTGMIAAVGISLHNFPEGLVVYNATITGVRSSEGVCASAPPSIFEVAALLSYMTQCMGRGLAVTIAIAMHNIPEGMAVAMPIYGSTRSRWTAMKWCLLSSICEPAAAMIFGFIFHHHLTTTVMNQLNALVAGIMVMLCVVELMPATLEHISSRQAALSHLLGQFVMFSSLHFLIESGGH